MGAVEYRITHRYAVVGRLDYGVLLSVQRTLAALPTVYDPYEAPHVLAVRHPRRASIIPSSEDPLVPHHNRADGQARTGRAGRHLVADTHEVLVP